MSKKVKVLFLERAGLKEFQFSHIGCVKVLEKISLKNNSIHNFNFSPVKVCKNLTYLNLSNNCLENIDLYPLKKCRNLQHLNLSGNKLKECDITPLLSLHYLGTGDFYFSSGFSIDEDVRLFAKKSFSTKKIPPFLAYV